MSISSTLQGSRFDRLFPLTTANSVKPCGPFVLLRIYETHHESKELDSCWRTTRRRGISELPLSVEDIMIHFTKQKLRIFGDVGNCMVFKNG